MSTIQETRDRKFAEWFANRRWRVMSEVSGERTTEAGVTIKYDGGHFVVDKPGVFQTPLGHRGREGFIVREVGADGSDLPDGQTVPFGLSVLQRAAAQFQAVDGLPDSKSDE
jgi:hypothetical protein